MTRRGSNLLIVMALGVSLVSGRLSSSLAAPTASAPQDSAGVISCLGDSITQGFPYVGTEHTYPSRLQAMLDASHGTGNLTVINHGIGGFRADQVLAAMQTLNWLAEDPDIVLLMVGGNDLAQEILPDPSNLMEVIERTVTEVQAIINLVKGHTNDDGSQPRIIVSACTPVLGQQPSAVVALYNQHLASDLTGFDMWFTDNWDDLYNEDTGQAHLTLLSDAVHPNTSGYLLIGENWFEAVNALLLTPTATHTPTATPTATPSLTPTITPTATPAAFVHLPLILR